jgi:hypothetical protein
LFADKTHGKETTAMKQYNPYSSRASLGAIGLYLRKQKIWDAVAAQVKIRQKTIRHSPMDKMCDAFMNILAGGQGIVEVNTRLRSDRALQRAFGRSGCADQSGVSHTLNACDEQNVEQLRQALQGIRGTATHTNAVLKFSTWI